MNKATCSEVALWVVLEYPDHGVGSNDPGERSACMLLVRLFCAGESCIEQDGVERTINAVDGIVVRVIGRYVSGAIEVVAKLLRHSRISTVEPCNKVLSSQSE